MCQRILSKHITAIHVKTYKQHTLKASQRISEMHVGTYNARTLNGTALDHFLFELSNMKWQIVGLCETKIPETVRIRQDDGTILLNSGNESGKKENGVGFLIHKSHVENIVDFDPISDRIAVLKIRANKISKCDVHIIQTYVPTTTHSDEEIELHYTKLQAVIDSVPQRSLLILQGDFNAKVGKLHNDFVGVVGPYTHGNYNERGIKLANFCTSNDFWIANSFFQKRTGRLWTWLSPDKKTKTKKITKYFGKRTERKS